MRILVLSGYDAASHKRWRQQLVTLPFEFETIALPPRHFRWRARGNALSIWGEHYDTLSQPWDLVIATSMVNVAPLRAMVPALRNVPWITYWHENQFVYPASPKQKHLVQLQVTNIFTALASDLNVFNSDYNRTSFVQGTQSMLAMMPDHVPSNVADVVVERSALVPVGVDDSHFPQKAAVMGPLKLLWNHRWEYDKAPDRFFNAAKAAIASGANIQLNVLGESFRKHPECFDTARDELGEVIDHWGYQEDLSQYRNIVASNDVVVSTSIHEFYGLSVMEAAMMGCRPLLPARLVYPELYPPHCLYQSEVDDFATETETLAEEIYNLADSIEDVRKAPKIDLEKHKWSNVRGQYLSVIERLV